MTDRYGSSDPLVKPRQQQGFRQAVWAKRFRLQPRDLMDGIFFSQPKRNGHFWLLSCCGGKSIGSSTKRPVSFLLFLAAWTNKRGRKLIHKRCFCYRATTDNRVVKQFGYNGEGLCFPTRHSYASTQAQIFYPFIFHKIKKNKIIRCRIYGTAHNQFIDWCPLGISMSVAKNGTSKNGKQRDKT